jgi:MraZ protein
MLTESLDGDNSALVSGRKWEKRGNSGVTFFSGMFRNTLDEKGRLILPAKLRDVLPCSSVVLTQGLERCIWLFPGEQWEELVQKIMERTSLFNENSRMIQRWFIAPAQEVEVDKTGRISIPQSLREFAHMGEGKECVIAGVIKRLEIWDSAEYEQYWAPRTDEMAKAVEAQLGDLGL